MSTFIRSTLHNRVLFSHKKNEVKLFAGKWIELENIMLDEMSQVQKSQRSPVFHYMWKLDLLVKCIYKYIYDHIYVYRDIHIHKYNERENKIVLVGLSKGTMGGRRGKEDVRERKILKQSIYICI
jgi:hypothetical protein